MSRDVIVTDMGVSFDGLCVLTDIDFITDTVISTLVDCQIVIKYM